MAETKKIKSPSEQRAERERFVIRKTLEGKYKQRFTIAKEGKAAVDRRDYRMMIYKYTEYLKILADTFEVATVYELKPTFFNAKSDVAELLLISQIYWKLAKVYDGSSKAKDKQELCLKQFIRFTIGMQYQGLNTEIIRKELKKKKFRNKELMLKSLESIYKESSACYLATYFECNQTELNILRSFKNTFLIKSSLGKNLVYYYYECSPSLILFFKNNLKLEQFLRIPILFLLRNLSYFLSKLGF